MALSDAEKAGIVGGVVGGLLVLGGIIYLLYLFRDKDIRLRLKLLYEDVETGGFLPVPGGANARVLDFDGASTPFEMGRTLVLADGVIDATVNDDGTREINPDIMFEIAAPVAPAAIGLITAWPNPGILNRQRRRDPLVGGISAVGVAAAFGAGTLGAPVTARGNAQRLALSNWHIFSGTAPAPAAPAAPAGVPAHNVTQPGRGDGGTVANDLIGQLSDHRLGDYGAPAAGMDAAVATLNATRPAAGGGDAIELEPRELVDDEPAPGAIGGPPAGVMGWELIDDDLVRGLVPDTALGPGILGLEVWKSGRTTGVTRGQITSVTFGGAHPVGGAITNLVIAQVRPDSPAPYVISAGGDSGSLVLEVGTNRAVALLFGGTSPQNMVSSRLQSVLDAFATDLDVLRVVEDYVFRRFYRGSFFGIDRTWLSRDDVPEPLRGGTFFPSYSEEQLEATIEIPLTGLQVHARFVYFDATLMRFMPLPEGIVVEILDRRAGAARLVLGSATTNANGEIHAAFAAPIPDPLLGVRITRDPANRFPDDASLRKLDRLGFFPGGPGVSRYESHNGGLLRFDDTGATHLEVDPPLVEDLILNKKSAGTVDVPLLFPVALVIGPDVARRDRDTPYRAYSGGAGTTWGVFNVTQGTARPDPPNGAILNYRPDPADAAGDRIRITSPRGGPGAIVITVADARAARIPSDPLARSFHPERASDTREVRLFVDMPAPGAMVTWEQSPLDATHTGQVAFQPGPGTRAIQNVSARFPGRTRVRALVADPGGDLVTEYVTISVPQFVRVVFLSEFDQDLVAFGLRREAPAGGSLTDEQKQVNERVKQAVMDQALNVARWHFDNAAANVRFTTRDLAALTTMPFVLIEVGGGRPAAGHPAVPANRVDGAALALTRAMNTGVFPGEFLNFSMRPDRAGQAAPAAKDAQFDQVFDALRPGAGGMPVGEIDAGGAIDYPIVPPGRGDAERARYDQIVRAIRVLGNLIGESLAHHTGHALGLAHSGAAAPRQLMDDEADRGFTERALSGSGLGAEFTHAEADQLHQTVGRVQPFITSVTPNVGPIAGGSPVRVDGRGFTSVADTHLTIMGIPVAALMVTAETTIRCNTPGRVAGWAGPTRVFIANGEGTFLLPRGFSYV